MVDENRVKLMTKIAIYEKYQQSDDIVMSRYFRSDYVRYNVLKTWVASTVVYWAVIAAYIFLKFDELLAKINEIDYFDVIYKMLGGYVIFCAIFFLFASFVYNYRYFKAKPGLVRYNSLLKDLIELEGGPMRRGTLAKEQRVQNQVEEQPNERPRQTQQKTRVNRSQMVQHRIEEEEKRKEQQIRENVQKRNERIAAQNQARILQEQQAEQDRRMIQQRRQELERAQLEKLRNERMQQMARENHVYGNNQNGNNNGREI